MKTLHVETGRHLYGGPQQVLYLTRGLKSRNVGVTLVCPPKSALAAAASAAGVEVVELPYGGELDVRFIWRLREVLTERQPDIVHCHSRRGGDFLGGQAATMARIPAVVSRRVDNRELRLIGALRYRNFAHIVAISETIAAVLRRAGVDQRRLSVIRSAVDVQRFATRPDRRTVNAAFGLQPEDQIVVAAGQLIPRKGHRYLIDAAAALKATHPRLRIVVCGQGREEGKLRQQASALGVDDIVHFAGFKQELDDYLGGFDLLVHTALAEGLGVIALKAQAAGLPVIAFAAGGLPEIVADRHSGLLVPPADAAQLATAIAALLDDEDRRKRYAAAARQRACEHFALEPMIDAHVKLYEAVLSG